MVNKIDFTVKNLTSKTGLFLLLEIAKTNGVFELIENDLVFKNESTNKIKMNHIMTMLCVGRPSFVKNLLGKWDTIEDIFQILRKLTVNKGDFNLTWKLGIQFEWLTSSPVKSRKASL